MKETVGARNGPNLAVAVYVPGGQPGPSQDGDQVNEWESVSPGSQEGGGWPGAGMVKRSITDAPPINAPVGS